MAPVMALAMALVCVATILPAAGHDFWLQPKAFRVERDEATLVTMLVGHGAERQPSSIPMSRILRFEATGPGGATQDLRDTLSKGDKPGGIARFPDAGTYVLSLATDDRAFSRLPATRFNEYLAREGLTPAIEFRKRMRQTDADGTEYYGRRAKAIIQVGAPTTAAQTHVTRPTGLTLEIVPEVNPYAEPRPRHLPVKVIFEGRPLAGALVKLASLERHARDEKDEKDEKVEGRREARLTDPAGRVEFPMPKDGSWRLTVVWTKPTPRADGAEFETLFSSLSFGLPSGRS